MKQNINIQPLGINSQVKPEKQGNTKLHNSTTGKRNISGCEVVVGFLMGGMWLYKKRLLFLCNFNFFISVSIWG